jgi:hypothetical protein
MLNSTLKLTKHYFLSTAGRAFGYLPVPNKILTDLYVEYMVESNPGIPNILPSFSARSTRLWWFFASRGRSRIWNYGRSGWRFSLRLGASKCPRGRLCRVWFHFFGVVRRAYPARHDWGSQICYEAARMRPDIIGGVVGAVVPVCTIPYYVGPSRISTTSTSPLQAISHQLNS